MEHSKQGKNKHPLAFSERCKSFGHAAKGFRPLLREPNIKLHILATIMVLVAGTVKNLSRIEWCLVILAIGLVWIAETLNTAIEKVCNLYTTNIHPLVKIIKDISAFAVLFAAIASALIGIIIFFF